MKGCRETRFKINWVKEGKDCSTKGSVSGPSKAFKIAIMYNTDPPILPPRIGVNTHIEMMSPCLCYYQLYDTESPPTECRNTNQSHFILSRSHKTDSREYLGCLCLKRACANFSGEEKCKSHKFLNILK